MDLKTEYMMTDTGERFDRATLLAKNDASWAALWATINAHSEEELTAPLDAGGWPAKDHLAHLAAWERGFGFLLHGHALRDGLGVSEETYRSGDFDTINAEIEDHVKDRLLPDILTDLRAAHTELLGAIGSMTDEDLHQPIDYTPPWEDAHQPQPPLADKIPGYTFEHFDLHRGWIEALLEKGRA